MCERMLTLPIHTDPIGPDISEYHVTRGGSFLDEPDSCRSTYRSSSIPLLALDSQGFRVVRRP
ncbi:MAG TPA: hypothetical protein DHV69_02705 [Sphaerochaeta sp.]|nr:hypothetical protein [Sphaerochaeta sp.]